MIYRNTRNYDNLCRAHFEGIGEYGIPYITPQRAVPEVSSGWIGFNYAKTRKDPAHTGLHFFVDDYQFTRLWTNPDAYLGMLRGFEVVCTPDFSLYTDFPKAYQVWNHYRKHWLGAYWQQNGVRVIPTIGWADEDSFAWCFDGEPKDAVVAVSSVGTQLNPFASEAFRRGV